MSEADETVWLDWQSRQTEMTTDRDLLADYTPLEACENVMSNHHEIEGQNYLGNPTRECAECGSYFPCEVYSFAKALRAVVARDGWMETDIGTEKELGYRMGYNQCLADIKADIAKELS